MVDADSTRLHRNENNHLPWKICRELKGILWRSLWTGNYSCDAHKTLLLHGMEFPGILWRLSGLFQSNLLWFIKNKIMLFALHLLFHRRFYWITTYLSQTDSYSLLSHTYLLMLMLNYSPIIPNRKHHNPNYECLDDIAFLNLVLIDQKNYSNIIFENIKRFSFREFVKWQKGHTKDTENLWNSVVLLSDSNVFSKSKKNCTFIKYWW